MFPTLGQGKVLQRLKRRAKTRHAVLPEEWYVFGNGLGSKKDGEMDADFVHFPNFPKKSVLGTWLCVEKGHPSHLQPSPAYRIISLSRRSRMPQHPLSRDRRQMKMMALVRTCWKSWDILGSLGWSEDVQWFSSSQEGDAPDATRKAVKCA